MFPLENQPAPSTIWLAGAWPRANRHDPVASGPSGPAQMVPTKLRNSKCLLQFYKDFLIAFSLPPFHPFSLPSCPFSPALQHTHSQKSQTAAPFSLSEMRGLSRTFHSRAVSWRSRAGQGCLLTPYSTSSFPNPFQREGSLVLTARTCPPFPSLLPGFIAGC